VKPGDWLNGLCLRRIDAVQDGYGAKTFGPESKNVLYSIGTTVYRLTTRWQLVTLKLSMKRRRPKSLFVVVAAAGAPSESAIS
jgi:hypothetical protein